MKRRNLLTAIAAIVMIFALAACSESVALEDRLGTITFGENNSRAVGTVVKYSNEVEDMIWFYEATKQDDGYTTGKTDGFEAVAKATKAEGQSTYTATAGLSGQTLNNNFSYGLWEIVLEGYKKDNVEVSSEGKVTIKTEASAEYTATISNFLVNKGANYATAQIQLGDNPETKIVFDTVNGISFSAGNIQDDSVFTLAVTDTKGTVAVATSDGVNDVKVESGKVTFYDLTYTKTDDDISGEHTMNFVLSQTLSGTGNTKIEAALYTLKFSVQKGTTTTISGTLVKNDVTGTVQINSVQDVPAITMSKVLPVESISAGTVSGETTTAKVSEAITLTNGNLKVTYPEGALIATDNDGLTTSSGDATTGTSDGKMGIQYTSSTASEGISIQEADSLENYELTLSSSQGANSSNSALVVVEFFYGKNREVSTVYHAGAKLDEYSELPETAGENGKSKTTTESYAYSSESGWLTLRVFHASQITVVTKEYVAEVNTTKYYSLSEAITAAGNNGGTVTLLRPVTLSETITVSKNITLDMARRAVTGSGKIEVDGDGVVTVQNCVAGQAAEFISAGAKISSATEIEGKYYSSLSKACAAAVNGEDIWQLSNCAVNYDAKVYDSTADKTYANLSTAVLDAPSGSTLVLLHDSEGEGLQSKDKDKATYRESLIIDFKGHTYTMTSSPTGSTGYENQAMHWGRSLGSIKLMNGTFMVGTSVSGIKMGMQNYITFTAENMVLDFANITPQFYGTYTGDDAKYNGLERLVWGNNDNGSEGSGVMVLKNTTVKTNDKSNYGICASNGSLTLENSTIEGYASFDEAGGSITLDSTSKITKRTKSYFDFIDVKAETADGKTTYIGKEIEVAEVETFDSPNVSKGKTSYSSLSEAIAAAGKVEGYSTVRLLRDVTVSESITINRSIELDLNNKVLTVAEGGSISLPDFDNTKEDFVRATVIVYNVTSAQKSFVTNAVELKCSNGWVYASLLEDALVFVVDGATITLGKNATLSPTYQISFNIDANFTLDLNGNTVNPIPYTQIYARSVTVKGSVAEQASFIFGTRTNEGTGIDGVYTNADWHSSEDA